MPLPTGHSSSRNLHDQVSGTMLGCADGGMAPQSSGPDDSQMYYRGNVTGLATVSEEEILHTAGTGSDASANLDLDLAEYAAAAVARGPRLSANQGAEPTRVLIIRHVAPDVPDSELQEIFKAFGDVQGLYTASKQLGLVLVAYYDVRCAASAQGTLNGTLIDKVAIDIEFAPPLRGAANRPVQQGQVVVFNMDPDTSNEQLVWLFSKFGDVQGIKQSPTRTTQKFITFFDIRHAAAAMRAMNRAEHLNKVPSCVAQQPMATLQTVSSCPNLVQHASVPGIDATTAAAAAAALTGRSHGASSSWDNLANPAVMEGLLHLVSKQQQQAQQHQGGVDGAAVHRNRLDLESLAAAANTARGLPLSDSASSIASVPGNLFTLPQSGKGLPNHHALGHMAAAQGPARSLLGADTGAGIYSAAASTQQQLQMLQASEAASMLMGLNLNGNLNGLGDTSQWGMQDLSSMGLQGLSGLSDVNGAAAAAAAAAAGVWPNSGGVGGLLGNNLSQLATLQALQAAGMSSNISQFKPSANLQAAAQILQAAGLNQYASANANAYNVVNPYAAASAAQILQHAGLGGLSGLGGLQLNQMMAGMAHGGVGGRGPAAAGMGLGGDSGLGSRNGGRLSRRTTDPTAETERKAQQEKLYALDLDKIARGEDKRTTLMIKNIPNKYTQKMLLATIDDSFRGTYDFFYLPIDFKNKCNVGYAFINVVQPLHIIPLVQRFNHKKWERFNSEKVCNISYARIQGRAALIQHFQNSSLMHEDKRCRPILFTLEDSGEVAGEQEPFPTSSMTCVHTTFGSSCPHGGGHMNNSSSAGLTSFGSGNRLSGLAGSTNSLRSQGGSTNSLRDLVQRSSVTHA